jgi:hypothetical protein
MNTFSGLRKKYKIKADLKGPKFRVINLDNVNIIQKVYDHWRENDNYSWADAPSYKGVGLHYSLKSKVDPKAKQVCGEYNQANYNDTLSYDQELPNNFLREITGFKTVRSKITELSYDPNQSDKELWHNDESPFEALRVIVPIDSHPVYKFQMDDQDPVYLEPGKVYAFDQSVPHRVFCSEPTLEIRLHLILGIVTWFHYIEGIWVPNEYCDKVHPLEFLDSLEIV